MELYRKLVASKKVKTYVFLILTILYFAGLIAFFLRAVSLLFTLLETGALVLVATVALAILLPVALILMLALLLAVPLQSARTNKRLRQELSGRTVYVAFGSAEAEHISSAFAKQNLSELARLLGSDDLTETAMVHARQMRAQAVEWKNK